MFAGYRTQPAAKVQYTADEERIFAATKKIGRGVLLAGAVGVLALGLWAAGQSQAGSPGLIEWLRLFGIYSLVACAAASAGALIGFLFGIPRTREAAATVSRGDDSAAVKQAVLTANTNLERVSDWLTTLLLGATLVQIKPIAEWVGGLGGKIRDDPAQAVTTVLVVYYLVLGFLGTYLVTRLYLTYALERMLGKGVEPVPTIDELRKQLEQALEATDEQTRDRALAAFERQNSRPEVAGEPALNLLAARVAARRLKGTPPPDAAGKQKLQADAVSAIKTAATNPNNKSQLQTTLRPEFDHFEESYQSQINAALA